jgi:hypothetical protein
MTTRPDPETPARREPLIPARPQSEIPAHPEPHTPARPQHHPAEPDACARPEPVEWRVGPTHGSHQLTMGGSLPPALRPMDKECSLSSCKTTDAGEAEA